ncbi:MAG: hypothetical protein OHK006_14350 [Thermodesulfovibrionales bacterium]
MLNMFSSGDSLRGALCALGAVLAWIVTVSATGEKGFLVTPQAVAAPNIPLLDQQAPSRFETATFSLG